jgi:hypothetical protein
MKRRTVVGIAVAVSLFLTGWTLGKAQMTTPTFELQIDAPGGGPTMIRCLRGCELKSMGPGTDPNYPPQSAFNFDCGSRARCTVSNIGGWTR